MNIIRKETETQTSPFDAIRGYRADGTEYWTARELTRWLGYTNWRNGEKAIQRAIKSLENQGQDVTKHIDATIKYSHSNGLGQREITDYELSRFACYLVAMNADPEKEMVAQAQSYFAKKTREAEVVGSQSTQPKPLLIEQSETVAQCVERIQAGLGRSNPRLAQILIDIGVNDFVESHQPKLTALLEFPEDRWYGLVQIADKMGIKTDASSRVKLGQYVGKLGLERVQEERLCNGEFRPIWCYRDNEETRQAILDWYNDR